MRSFLGPPLVTCVLSLALLAPSVALASGASPLDASAAQKTQAMDHFSAGKKAIVAKNWEMAALELRASLEIVDSPNARLELARALRDSDKLDDAWTEYGRVIESATKLAAREPRYTQTADAASGERKELEPKLAFIAVTVAHAPAGATLKVGGRTVPPEQWTAPIVAFPGAVDVVLSDAGGKELARAVVPVAVGEKTEASLDAQPAQSPTAGAAGTSAPRAGGPPGGGSGGSGDDPATLAAEATPTGADAGASTPSDRHRVRAYAYVAGGVGLAGMAMFAVFGLMSNAAYGDLQSACPPPSRRCPPDKQSEVSSGRTQQTIANVSAVVGAVGLAAGVTLFVVSLQGKPSPDTGGTALEVGPAYVGVRGSL
jgi:hypothetical protein